jgi:hypothetical protein
VGDFLGGKLEDFVRRAANLEGANGLKALGLEPDFLRCAVAGKAGEWGVDERGFYGDRGDASRRGANFSDGNQLFCHAAIIYFGLALWKPACSIADRKVAQELHLLSHVLM